MSVSLIGQRKVQVSRAGVAMRNGRARRFAQAAPIGLNSTRVATCSTRTCPSPMMATRLTRWRAIAASIWTPALGRLGT